MTSPAVTTPPEWHALQGFGRSVGAPARMFRPVDADEVLEALRRAREDGRRLCLRAGGRSYGDAAVHDGDVLDLRGLTGIALDVDAGMATVGAGVTIGQLWRASLPYGLWPMVVPGTQHATIGGCLAMHVHGKNQFRDGAIGEHVASLQLATPDGVLRDVVAGRDDELLRALVSGFGMLGVITSATLRMRRVESGDVAVERRRVATLRAAFEVLDELAERSDYVVGWVDGFSRRGASVLHGARHLAAHEDPHPEKSLQAHAQEPPGRVLGVVPNAHASLLARPFAHSAGVRVVNLVRRALSALHSRELGLERIAAFSFLLDRVPHWRDFYGAGGMLQHQSVVPHDAAPEVHGRLLEMCRAADLVPWLAVLKKHRSDEFLLTHSLDGWSLALDFRVTRRNRERLWALCRDMDETVISNGGSFYPAKDQTATADAFRRAFPSLPAFRAWKTRLDPDGVLTSALAERLGVVDAHTEG